MTRTIFFTLLTLLIFASGCSEAATAAPDAVVEAVRVAVPPPTEDQVVQTYPTQGSAIAEPIPVERYGPGVHVEGAISPDSYGESFLNLIVLDNETGSLLPQTWVKVRVNGEMKYDGWVAGSLQLSLNGTNFSQLDLEVYDTCTISLASPESTLQVLPDGTRIAGYCTQ